MNQAVLQELKTYLEGQGVTAQAFLYSMPQQGADECILLSDYGDTRAPTWRVDGRLQVRTRAPVNDIGRAKALADQAHGILWPADQQVPSVHLQLATMTVVFEHLSGPLWLGPDGQGRPEFSINYRVQLGRS